MSGPAPCAITFFTDYAAASKREMLLELSDLAQRIAATSGPDKGSLPWLKCARFGDLRTAKGSLRHDANLIAVTGVEADYDGERLSFDEARDRLGAAGLLAILYTSPSHTEDAPRWRVLCPFAAEHAPAERDRFLARLNGLFDGIFSNESWTRSQSYYYGAINGNPSHRVALLDGAPLDLVVELDGSAIGKPAKPNGAGTNGAEHHGPPTPPEAITDRRINGLIQSLLDNIRRAPDGAKYFTLRDISFTVGGYLHLTDWTAEQAVEACVAALPSANDYAAARRTAAAAIAAGQLKPLELADRPRHGPQGRSNGSHGPVPGVPPVGEPDKPDHKPDKPDPKPDKPDGPGDEWIDPNTPDDEPPDPPSDDGPSGRPMPPEIPVILCVAGELPRMVRQAEAALLAAGVEVYQRLHLVHPIVDDHDAIAADGSKTHSARLVAFDAPTMLKLLSEVATFQKFNARARAFVTCDPPDKVVQILLAGRGSWPFPKVRGVLTCPTLRSDGSVLKDKGYDRRSQYYMAIPDDLVLPELPPMPTRQDAEDSLRRLEGLLAEFRFVDAEVDGAVALCVLMTQVLRCGMECSPLLAVSARAPGTGKSFLVDLASAIALGRPCAVIPPGKNEEETEKGIRTKLLSGTPAFSIDNVHGDLNLPLLNQATERTMISIRIFGVLEELEVENSMVVYMTGNNLAIVGDQGRRSFRCEMDAKEERPEHRRFKVNPIDTVMADRGRYVADVLIIARAYLTCGEPRPDIPPIGDSYRGWCKLVREPLIWLGCVDPIRAQESARQGDPVTSRLEAIIEAWHAAFGFDAKTLADASRYATTPPTRVYDPDPRQNAINQAVYEADRAKQEILLAALRDGFAAGKDGVNTHAWGNWMRRYEGAMRHGMRFVKVKEEETAATHKGSARWQLEK